jgi:tRNA-dihydrouridine synthase
MNTILYMAPIRGITNSTYRNTYARFFDGYSVVVTPFLRSCNVSSAKHKVLRDLFKERNHAPYECVPQLLTKRAEEFMKAATHLYTLGYETVNWNLGCPHKRIRDRLHGSGLLAHPDRICKILDHVLPKIQNKVSLKVRLGGEDKRELPQLLGLLNAYPIKEIIIHPRTGKEMYSGSVDIEAFQECLLLTKHKVIFNGDINSLNTYRSLRERFPTLDTWMIGRGGVINPFLAEEISLGKRENEDTRVARFIEFHNELFQAFDAELSGWTHKAAKLKEYWYYWSQGFEEGRELFYALTRTHSKEEYRTVLGHFFEKRPRLLI